MPLHLIKLCVGATSIADLEQRNTGRLAGGGTSGVVHVTRMVPTRADDLLAGGSLFWVIAGQVSARQALLAIEPFNDGDGIRRCRLLLDAAVVPVVPRPQRVFQGWRYLQHDARPADLAGLDGGIDMPEDLRRALRDLCLL